MFDVPKAPLVGHADATNRRVTVFFDDQGKVENFESVETHNVNSF